MDDAFLSVIWIVWFFISLHCSSLIHSHRVAGWGKAPDPVYKQILVDASPSWARILLPRGPQFYPASSFADACTYRMALQGLTSSLQPWAEVTSNKKPAQLLALV